MKRVVLLFHRLATNRAERDDVGAPPDLFASASPKLWRGAEVRSDCFARCLLMLKGKPPRGHSVAITFDDGWESDYTAAFPLLVKQGVAATFFVIASQINQPGRLRAAWMREMSDCGMEFGSHTWSHRYLTRLSDTEIARELSVSKGEIEQVLGRKISALSVPGGDYNDRILFMAEEAGYDVVATSRPGINGHGARVLRRVSIDSLTSQRELRQIVGGSSTRFAALAASYAMRYCLRQAIGVDRYMTLKETLT